MIKDRVEKIFTGSISYTNRIIREITARGYKFVSVRKWADGKYTYKYVWERDSD